MVLISDLFRGLNNRTSFFGGLWQPQTLEPSTLTPLIGLSNPSLESFWAEYPSPKKATSNLLNHGRIAESPKG